MVKLTLKLFTSMIAQPEWRKLLKRIELFKLDNSPKILYAYHFSNVEVRMLDNKIRIRANKYTSIVS